MVRFARSKGSKASNERSFEEATPWSEMKQQMIQADNKVFEKSDVSSAVNNDIDEVTYSKSSWAEFDIPSIVKEKKPHKQFSKVNEEFTQTKKQKLASKLVELPNSPQEGSPEDYIHEKKRILEVETTEQTSSRDNDLEVTARPKEKKLKHATEQTEQSHSTCDENSGNISLEKKKRKDKLKQEKRNKISTPNDVSYNQTIIDSSSIQSEKMDQNQLDSDQNPSINSHGEGPDKNFKREGKFENKSGKKSTFTKLQKKKATFSRKKPYNAEIQTINVGGRLIETRKFDGYSVLKDDWERLCELKKEMKAKGIPGSEMKASLKLERRRAEKAFTREWKKVCFHCRQPGHLLPECPSLDEQNQFSKKKGIPESVSTGICFKCGSTEHTYLKCRVVKRDDFKFASCFVCGEQGHISRQCPDNPRGMYPKGGACKVCGDVTHLKKDCPQYQQDQQQSAITLPTLKNKGALEALEIDISQPTPAKKDEKKVVKF